MTSDTSSMMSLFLWMYLSILTQGRIHSYTQRTAWRKLLASDRSSTQRLMLYFFYATAFYQSCRKNSRTSYKNTGRHAVFDCYILTFPLATSYKNTRRHAVFDCYILTFPLATSYKNTGRHAVFDCYILTFPLG